MFHCNQFLYITSNFFRLKPIPWHCLISILPHQLLQQQTPLHGMIVKLMLEHFLSYTFHVGMFFSLLCIYGTFYSVQQHDWTRLFLHITCGNVLIQPCCPQYCAFILVFYSVKQLTVESVTWLNPFFPNHSIWECFNSNIAPLPILCIDGALYTSTCTLTIAIKQGLTYCATGHWMTTVDLQCWDIVFIQIICW